MDKNKAEILRMLGFRYNEQKVDNKTLYAFIGTPDLVQVIAKNFAKGDYCISKTMNFKAQQPRR
ncbi:MAG: hypothetical protein NC299_17000 [Lachnospiraceae bacterium]|nr:hypothetical protein [Lachnospiraceae bacterium]